jgi:sugar (pentulose or hexulose) kinase
VSLVREDVQKEILQGTTVLGIELGSTRIKAILINQDHEPIASGGYDWSNRYVDGIWTYNLEEVWEGIRKSYKSMVDNVVELYDVDLTSISAIGFSAMMHGYMVFDKNNELLVPFRTWRNNMTEEASKILMDRFQYPIPQRWSIAHLYQALLNHEDHVSEIDFITTLAGYVHWQLTGQKVIGVGEASGMFPIDIGTQTYNNHMIDQFDELIRDRNYPWKLKGILPRTLVAGEKAGTLTQEGAKLLDPSGVLQPGIPLCPPEGDAGTGMVATNSVAPRTGNVSAGTSIFAMVVLEKDLSKVHPELDLITTPTGKLVGMAHSNNCTSNLNAWVELFEEAVNALGVEVDKNTLYKTLYTKALEGDPDCGGLLAYGYLSGEHMTHFEEGRPLFVRTPESKFNLANFMRVNLVSALGAMKIGMDILLKEEKVNLDKMLGHGGLFKTEVVGQRLMAAAVNAPVVVMDTAGEGGAWGIAVLASYMINGQDQVTLEAYLEEKVFINQGSTTIEPDASDVEGFEAFMVRYKKGLPIERAAIDYLK